MINKFQQLKEDLADKLPTHIGIILDGNRRWAKKNKFDVNQGHFKGYEVIKDRLYNLLDAGIKYLTIYALSLENYKKRSDIELRQIYKILMKAVDTVISEPIVVKEKVKFNVIGRWNLFPSEVQKKIKELLEFTKNHNNNFVNVCLMYDGQEEIVDAVKQIIKNKVNPEEVDTKLIKKYLYTREFPEADYIIRTGMADGTRISGFLLWDSSYAEFKFREDLWPDYSEDLLYEDLIDFTKRSRRKGT